MAIYVKMSKFEMLTQRFADATGWHVDDTGQLHITKTGSGNVATFHPSAWLSVERNDEAGGIIK